VICPCYSRERRCDDCQRREDERAADEAKTDLAAEAALFEASAVIFDDPHDDSPQDEADLQREERAADEAKTAAAACARDNPRLPRRERRRLERAQRRSS